MVNSHSCSCLHNMFILNVRYIIMANRNKFLHNLNKAKRQRKNERDVFNNLFKNYSKGLIKITKDNEQT